MGKFALNQNLTIMEENAMTKVYCCDRDRGSDALAYAAMANNRGNDPWSKDQVDDMLKRNGVTLENAVGQDYVFVANMAKADFLGSSIADEAHLARYVKDVVDDPDQADGFIFNRWYADTVRSGIPVDWEGIL